MAQAAAANNVKLLSCSYTGGIMRVQFQRPLKASDKCDLNPGSVQFLTPIS